MKAKDILPVVPEGECDLCALHNAIEERPQIKMNCPICGGRMRYHDENAISEHYWYDKDDEVWYGECYECEKCEKFYALLPVEVHYAGGHDVFYKEGIV